MIERIPGPQLRGSLHADTLTRRDDALDATAAAWDRTFFRQVTLPILLLILLLVGLVGTGLYWDVTRSNVALMDRQVRMARMAVAASVDDLAYQQQSNALWQPLVNKLRERKLDLPWIDESCGGWLYRMFGHDWVILLGPDDHVVYASHEGIRVAPARVDALRPALQALIDGARGRTLGKLGPHDRRAGGLVSPATTVLTKPSTIHESDLLLIGRRPAAASVMRIMSVRGDGSAGEDTGYMMADIRFLDGAYLQQLSRRNLIAGLHFSLSPNTPEGRTRLPAVQRQ